MPTLSARVLRVLLLLLTLVLATSACSDEEAQDPMPMDEVDSGFDPLVDASDDPQDLGQADQGQIDQGQADQGQVDQGQPDTADPDLAEPDLVDPDMGAPDITEPEDTGPSPDVVDDMGEPDAEPDMPTEDEEGGFVEPEIDWTDLPELPEADVPRRWPEPSLPAATHDVDTDLALVLERENLEGACDAVANGTNDRETRLRCGKWMFFYEHFDTTGIPRDLLVFLQKYYADSFYGRGFSNMGFVPDPDSAEGLPIGLVTSSQQLGDLQTSAFTCASCHFGQLSDGRYAVGYGNQALDYGTLIGTLGAPLTLSANPNAPDVHPDIREMLREPVAQAQAQPLYLIDLGIVGVSLLINAGDSQPQLDQETQEAFLNLDTGTMDFLTSPLVEDGSWTVSRIISLWNLPDEAMRQEHGMEHETLSWTGVVDTLMRFIEGFVFIGVSDEANVWTEERLLPLAEYMMTLRAPEPLTVQDPLRVEYGARLFAAEGCQGCHNGPSGESSQLYTYEEMGVDDALSNIYTPDENGVMCCGFGEGGRLASLKIKAPRMTSVETQRRFLHNGAISSLEQLFCLEPRREDAPYAQGAQGHWMTCEDMDVREKLALIAYLRTL